MILDIISGFAAALLSGLGVGSGGLLVIYLTLVLGAEQLRAQGTNLLFFLFSSGAAMLYHFSHRKINYSAVTVLVLTGLVGSAVGTALSSALGGALTRKLFGSMLVLSGIATLRKCKKIRQSAYNKTKGD